MHDADLLALVPDKQAQAFLQGLLETLGLKPLTAKWEPHLLHDAGCFEADEVLQPQAARYEHALVVLNRSRSGHEELSRERMEHDIEERLSRAGWQHRARAIVIEPALDQWLLIHEFGQRPAPGESVSAALEACLRQRRQPRSPTLYRRLGKHMVEAGSSDPAWHKLVDTLRGWFGQDANPEQTAAEPEGFEELDLRLPPEVQRRRHAADELRQELEARIESDPTLCGGKPRIRGHRIWVSTVLGLLAGGWSTQQVIENYPGLTELDIRACLALAAKAVETLHPGSSTEGGA